MSAWRKNLRARQQARRAQQVLLKDLAPIHLAMACADLTDEERPDPAAEGVFWSYLKYASQEQIAFVCGCLPHVVQHIVLGGPIASREVILFPVVSLKALLRRLVTEPKSYLPREEKARTLKAKASALKDCSCPHTHQHVNWRKIAGLDDEPP